VVPSIERTIADPRNEPLTLFLLELESKSLGTIDRPGRGNECGLAVAPGVIVE
jgi:hypothetical protein